MYIIARLPYFCPVDWCQKTLEVAHNTKEDIISTIQSLIVQEIIHVHIGQSFSKEKLDQFYMNKFKDDDKNFLSRHIEEYFDIKYEEIHFPQMSLR